ncbi:MAG TPA: glutaredoxin domain-containing protein [Anaeromyxobacteraceae bacterium]|nr:glutaredoxin domain-containing protein [Anaeromyxobacteraceae bacterium]
MTLANGRTAGAIAALGALVAGGWLGLSSLDPSRAAQVPGGVRVRRLNGALGQWLVDRSVPLPDCPDDDSVASGAGQPRAGGATDPREVVEGLYRWTDAKGVAHYTDEEERVPKPHRAGSKVRTLPLLTVYHGEYSRLPGGASAVTPAAPRPSARGSGARAVVYSAAWCGACKKTKAWLAEQGVAVEERDVDRDPRALSELVAIAGKNPSIPVTVIGGRAVGGFDPDELRRALAAAGR